MTACSNTRRHGAVVAALVGAMSLGAPAVALAANGGIEVLAVDWNTGAKVSKATDGKGSPLTGDLSKQEIVAGEGRYLLPTQLTNSNGDTFDIDGGYTVDYYTKASGKYTLVATTDLDAVNAKDSTLKLPEEYFRGANPSDSENGVFYLKVVKGDSQGANATEGYFYFKLVNEKSDETTLSLKDELTYDGAKQEPVFVDEDGAEYDAKNYTIDYQDANGKTVVAENLINAGTYYATVKKGAEEIDVVTFEIAKYDVSKASLSFNDVKVGTEMASQKDFVKAVTGLATDSGLSVSKVADPDGKLVDTSTGFFGSAELKRGTYTFTIKADDKNNSSLVSGTGTVTVQVVDNLVSDQIVVYYDGTKSTEITVDLAKGEKFDASKVSIKVDGTTYKGDDIEITLRDKKGNEVDAATVAAAGTSDTFWMSIRLVPQKDFVTGELTGGTSKEVKISVKGSEVDASKNVAFYLDGELAGKGGEVTYDGTDQLEKLSVSVKADGKEYVEGTDYKVEVKNKAGKVVTEAVDSDEYTVTVTPITFTFTEAGKDSDTFKLTVEKVQLDRLVPETVSMLFDADEKTGYIPEDNGKQGEDRVVNEFYVAYTGEAVEVPAVSYQVEDGDDYSYVTLDPSLYTVTSVKKGGKVVKEAVDEDDYEVTIALAKDAEKNYKIGACSGKFTFTVEKFGHFTDVDSAKWYSVPVEKAYEVGYINGISGTNLYSPEASMTRADAICVLFNMAGGEVGSEDFEYSEDKGYETGFSDVDGHAYFAKALAWAKASGVANGSDGEFRPYDKVSRQEFAAFLANFAKSKGDWKAPSDGALDAIEDAEGVSAWATEVVSWAVENGVMGNKGYVYATSDISRAEVAAMAVNYQPENLTGLVRLPNGTMGDPNKA